ncbi:MAG TPA: hypothetical protein VNA16_07865, partial [Abditibacteriaceae bacterium]|nr:hypothetical protein [Abditibacteriaceae bacterium]
LNEARARQYLPGEWSSAAPRPGDRWRANLYRIKETAAYTEYQAWSPTITAGFHNPARAALILSCPRASATSSAWTTCRQGPYSRRSKLAPLESFGSCATIVRTLREALC